MATKAYAEQPPLKKAYFAKVEALSALLREAGQNSIALKKSSSNLFRHRHELPKKRLDVRACNHVISINTETLTAEVEGMTTYETLVDAALRHNLMPTVVPELKSITVGGALAGLGIEASSFRYGLVHETVQEFDVLLSDGSLITCKPDNEHRDLFYAFPNTFGTLGYALRVVVKLVQTKKYVKVNHQRFDNPESFFSALQVLCQQNKNAGPKNFIEGVAFDEKSYVISTAEFCDEAPFVSNYRYLNIYYRSLLKRESDYLSCHDFIWRWDPDWFWCSKHFMMQHFLPRLLLGKWMLKSTAYWKIRRFASCNPIAKAILQKFEKPTESVIQDVEIPIQHAAEFLAFFQQEIGIKPVWTCPTQAYAKDKLFNFYRMDAETLYINFGFWDTVPTTHEDGYFNRKIEEMVKKLQGHKSLYSTVYYPEETFWKIYDKSYYEQLKQKYDPKGILGNLYSKCTKK